MNQLNVVKAANEYEAAVVIHTKLDHGMFGATSAAPQGQQVNATWTYSISEHNRVYCVLNRCVNWAPLSPVVCWKRGSLWGGGGSAGSRHLNAVACTVYFTCIAFVTFNVCTTCLHQCRNYLVTFLGLTTSEVLLG
jgi:hypothetical protein